MSVFMDENHQVEDENNFKNEDDETKNGAERAKRRKPRHEKNDKRKPIVEAPFRARAEKLPS